MCMDFADHIEKDNCPVKLVLCPTAINQVEKNKQYHGFSYLWRYHFFKRFERRGKIRLGIESEVPEICIPNDDDDVFLFGCALGSDVERIITIDGRLTVNTDCIVKIEHVSEFLANHNCDV